MSSQWASSAAPAVVADADSTVVVLEGSTFCQSASSGDVVPGGPLGLFVCDTRVISEWQLEIDGEPVRPLTSFAEAPYTATFVGRTTPRSGHADSTLLVIRRRYVGGGMREDIVLRNLTDEETTVAVTLSVDVDFADLFEVKESRVLPRRGVAAEVSASTLRYAFQAAGFSRTVQVTASGNPAVRRGAMSFEVVIPARAEWSTCLFVEVTVGGQHVTPHYHCGEHIDRAAPVLRMREWQLTSPTVTSGDPDLGAIVRISTRDLGALQIHDPEHPDRRVVAAGAPWYMALFGRDALLTSWMALPLDQRLALGTLQTLARFQGTEVNLASEEQPGRILHEIRLGREAAVALGDGQAYYGTADATPLFVALLGELHRWGLPRDELLALLPAADRALAWIETYGDSDGDGFVEYQRATDRGLLNQGWKDSFDGINDAAGLMGTPPIALAEVQAYVYASYLARASIATSLGDDKTAAACQGRAADLKFAFNERFWLPERKWFAVALDGDKRPLDALTSNLGHCLWCGIVDDDKAQAVAGYLVGPQMWTGFGVRTLASSMSAYNPMSYHNGSVWPHDSAIVASGLMRYGFVAEAQQVALGLLDAAKSFGGRLPELFCGFDSSDFPAPVPYPSSCSPQAWAAAAPLHLLRTLLRLDPDVAAGEVGIAPAIPRGMLPLHIENLPVGDARLTIDVTADTWNVSGLPEGVHLAPNGSPTFA